jgi:hypothetical protein
MCGIPQYEEKHNTICVGYHNTKKNTTHYVWDTTIRRKTQHNMCGIPQYEEKHNTICVGYHNTKKNTTQYAQTNTNNVNKI